jgi:HD-GYP domain-containing protein (c-di-GMP phosphodiesterase class II)
VAVFGIGLWRVIVNGRVDELREFALGCLLHDIGKTGISDWILNKPGKLDEQEFDEVKKHPQLGVELMKDSVSDLALDVILHHHERYDGTGYPEGLVGKQISDNAKIASIADVYDALTTNRPYSDARKPFNAVLLMKEQMVGHFEQEKFIKFIYMLSGK